MTISLPGMLSDTISHVFLMSFYETQPFASLLTTAYPRWSVEKWQQIEQSRLDQNMKCLLGMNLGVAWARKEDIKENEAQVTLKPLKGFDLKAQDKANDRGDVCWKKDWLKNLGRKWLNSLHSFLNLIKAVTPHSPTPYSTQLCTQTLLSRYHRYVGTPRRPWTKFPGLGVRKEGR